MMFWFILPRKMHKFCVLGAFLKSTILEKKIFLKSMILNEKFFLKSMILKEKVFILSDFELIFFWSRQISNQLFL